MGCQTNIAANIVAKQADYVLAVKDNQKCLHEAISDYFEVAIAADNPGLCQLQCHEVMDAGHGRIEIRRCCLSTCLDTLPDPARWKNLKSIGMVESERFVDGKTSIERRHYICTLNDVKPFAQAARLHCTRGHKGSGKFLALGAGCDVQGRWPTHPYRLCA